MSLKTAILSFLNALLNYGPGEQSLEFRLHLRFELLMLGIEAVVEKLKAIQNENIDKHIQFFEMVRAQDEHEFAKNWGEVITRQTLYTDSLLRWTFNPNALLNDIHRRTLTPGAVTTCSG